MARALRVNKKTTIRCQIDRLFEAVTKASELSRWFADSVSADLEEGTGIDFSWGSGATAHKARARVLRVRPGKSVMLRWEDSRSHSRDDYFSITLEKRQKSVLVVVVDFATKDTREELEEIWDECLTKLKETYETEG